MKNRTKSQFTQTKKRRVHFEEDYYHYQSDVENENNNNDDDSLESEVCKSKKNTTGTQSYLFGWNHTRAKEDEDNGNGNNQVCVYTMEVEKHRKKPASASDDCNTNDSPSSRPRHRPSLSSSSSCSTSRNKPIIKNKRNAKKKRQPKPAGGNSQPQNPCQWPNPGADLGRPQNHVGRQGNRMLVGTPAGPYPPPQNFRASPEPESSQRSRGPAESLGNPSGTSKQSKTPFGTGAGQPSNSPHSKDGNNAPPPSAYGPTRQGQTTSPQAENRNCPPPEAPPTLPVSLSFYDNECCGYCSSTPIQNSPFRRQRYQRPCKFQVLKYLEDIFARIKTQVDPCAISGGCRELNENCDVEGFDKAEEEGKDLDKNCSTPGQPVNSNDKVEKKPGVAKASGPGGGPSNIDKHISSKKVKSIDDAKRSRSRSSSVGNGKVKNSKIPVRRPGLKQGDNNEEPGRSNQRNSVGGAKKNGKDRKKKGNQDVGVSDDPIEDPDAEDGGGKRHHRKINYHKDSKTQTKRPAAGVGGFMVRKQVQLSPTSSSASSGEYIVVRKVITKKKIEETTKETVATQATTSSSSISSEISSHSSEDTG